MHQYQYHVSVTTAGNRLVRADTTTPTLVVFDSSVKLAARSRTYTQNRTSVAVLSCASTCATSLMITRYRFVFAMLRVDSLGSMIKVVLCVYELSPSSRWWEKLLQADACSHVFILNMTGRRGVKKKSADSHSLWVVGGSCHVFCVFFFLTRNKIKACR